MAHDIKHWLALGKVSGIGKIAYKSLIEEFKEPALIFDAPLTRLLEIPGIGKKCASNIKNFQEWDWVERETGFVKKHGITFLSLKDEAYPKLLLSIPDPPPYLYVKGSISEKDDYAVAIVGSRYATPYGLTSAEKIAQELAGWGITVVSGMARGIDSAAHRGALAGKGRTIAVLGSGIDIVYPPENKKLYDAIALHGAILSEFPMGTPPLAENFPQRNRIISGLSHGILVAEASLQSGSLITARLALDYGRDVFALPGSITSNKSKGTNRLIKDGAKLVEGAEDILEELRHCLPRAPRVDVVHTAPAERGGIGVPSSDEEKIINLLDEPCFIDTIIQQTGFSAQKVSSLLLDMELKGSIRQQPGKMFVRRS